MKFKNVKSSVSCIYRITFPDGKYYVGQTKNLAKRVRLYERCAGDASDNSRVVRALRACGIENVDIDILCEPSGLSDDDLSSCLSILEIKYIKENDCIYPKGYNTSIGGELLGIPADVIETKFGVTRNGVGCKPVLVYNLDGVFVSEYASISRCAYGLGVNEADVTSVLNKRGKLLRNTYMLREKKFGEVPDKIIPFEPEVVVQRKTKTEYDVIKEKTYKRVELTNAVVMYDKSGRYVGVFDNYRQSKLYLKIGDDYKVPFGREYRGVYLFHYNGGEIKKNIGEIKSKVVKTVLYDDILALGDAENIGELISVDLKKEEKPKREKKPKVEKPKKEKKQNVIVVPKKKPRILKYTLDGKYVSTYNTTVEAAAADCVYPSAILACAKKKVRRCGNFIYRFEGDELDLPKFSPITLKQRMPIEKNLFE